MRPDGGTITLAARLAGYDNDASLAAAKESRRDARGVRGGLILG